MVQRTIRIQTMLALTVVMCGGCARTIAGTHVEAVDQAGRRVYQSGAAAPGMNKQIACRGAVARAVAAVAEKFVRDNKGLADDIAKDMGISGGDALLGRYARNAAMGGTVNDETFDPAEHICMTAIRWSPPLFIKDAVRKYAEDLRAKELKEPAKASATPQTPGSAAHPTTGSAPAKPAAAVSPCAKQIKKLGKAQRTQRKAQADLDECLRRTQGDANICHRYTLYAQNGEKQEALAQDALDDCKARHDLE